MEKIQFGYYRGMEAEQYSFYRVPKILFTAECFKELSCEAKVLYGLLLDRMSFSMKNHWLDEEEIVKTTIQECPKSQSNNIDINKTENNKTESSNILSNLIYPEKEKMIDEIEQRNTYREIIRENISYECFRNDTPYAREEVDWSATTLQVDEEENITQEYENHAIYYCKTRDFRTFTKAELYHDGGVDANGKIIKVIDSTMIQNGEQIGEELDLTGVKVTAVFESGKTADVTEAATVDSGDFNSQKAGSYTITVTYAEKTETFVVTVKEKSPEIPDPVPSPKPEPNPDSNTKPKQNENKVV